MTTTEPITTPAWLNLDELCPPEVREEIADLTAAFGTYVYSMEDELKKARYLLKAIDASCGEARDYLRDQGVPCELHDLIMAATGADGLWSAMADLASAINPDNYDEEVIK